MIRQVENVQHRWQPTLIAIALILSWIGYWYWGTLEAMAQIWWRSETYAHGLIVPPITLWLIWRERHRLATFQPKATYLFALPLACLAFAWLLGELTSVNALTQFSIISIIILAIMSLVGLSISKELAFPLLFLLFAVPIGDFLLPRLMEWTADFTVLALRLTGIPVFREGQSFVIPSGNWSVVEACSGIRYLIASLTVGTLYAYLTFTSFKRRLIFIVVALLVPIVANWLRAYMIVMLGHISGNKLAVGVDHLIYGWVFFGVVILLMFAIGSRWAEPPQGATGKLTSDSSFHSSAGFPWPLSIVLFALLAAGPAIEHHIDNNATTTTLALAAPSGSGGWKAAPARLVWQPSFAKPSDHITANYTNAERWVDVHILYFRDQNYERKLVTSTNVLVQSNDPVWQAVGLNQVTAAQQGGLSTLRESQLINKTDGSRYVVWQWYWINGHLTSSDIIAKGLTAMNMLLGQGDDSAAIIVVAPQADAAQNLPDFCSDMLPALYDALDRVKTP